MANEQGYGSKDTSSMGGEDLGKGQGQDLGYDKSQDQGGGKSQIQDTELNTVQGQDLGYGKSEDLGGKGAGDDLGFDKTQGGSSYGKDFDTTDPQVTKTPDDDGRQTFDDDKLRTSGQQGDLSQGNLGKAGDPAEGKSY